MADEKKDAFDPEKVDQIVARMKKKYESEGRLVKNENPTEALSQLRGSVTGSPVVKLEIQPVEELRDENNRAMRELGSLFLTFRKSLGALAQTVERLHSIQELQYWLYSANLRYSARQWIAASVSFAALLFIAGLGITAFLAVLLWGDLGLVAALILLVPLFLSGIGLLLMLAYPRLKARDRGVQVSIELPFALRHMATEIRAGIGLNRTIQTLASADYGALSEEFSRVVSETEEGVDTKDALHNLAVRTQSNALRNAIRHINRALRTGGNLSEIIGNIAEDVSFGLRENIRDYAQKMNFFGVVFIFIAIVAPVLLTVLGAIRNSPVAQYSGTFNALPLTLPALIAILGAGIPIMLFAFIALLKMSQPRV